MPSIQLQSSDAENFKVDVKVASKSITIKTMLEDLGLEEDNAKIPVPLPNVDGKTLKKVIEWCTKHQDDDDQKIRVIGNLKNDTNDEKKEETSEDGWTAGKLSAYYTQIFLKNSFAIIAYLLHYHCIIINIFLTIIEYLILFFR